MTRIRRVGGTITERTRGNEIYYAENDIAINAVGNISVTSGKGVVFGEPETPPVLNQYFVKGWWSLDIEGNKKIKSAIPGMTVYFHLETKNIPNDSSVFMTLFEEDNSENEETQNEDDKITLINSLTKKESFSEKVSNNKIVKTITLKNIDSFIQDEVDKVLELYFKCSYFNEAEQFPISKDEYLKVGQIIVDRYKIPGLNENGTDSADDLCYGFGIKKGGSIFESSEVSDYVSRYEENGFDEILDEKISNKAILSDKNGKAKYSEAECYSAAYNARIPFTNIDIPISTGLDIRVFNNLSDDVLFWDFEQTASLYFATGLLETNLKQMIAKFKANEGGIYENEILTNAIIESEVTKKYCNDIEEYLKTKIKENSTELQKIEDKKPYLGNYGDIQTDRGNKNKTFTRPIYNVNKMEGLTIALNDIWATQITIKEMENDNNNYTCKYEVILWDHFGLDLPDMEKIFNIIPSVGEAFVTWFILQHLRGYKPFITKIKFEKEFEGTF